MTPNDETAHADRWTFGRREVLALGAATAIGLLVPTGRTRAQSDAASTPFALGVCSGDPDANSAVLWTRLVGPDGAPYADRDVEVVWEVATDPAFAAVTGSGSTAARLDEGHSVHVIARLTGPSWFRFTVDGAVSPVGRTQPAPAVAAELRVATASCQHFETGYYAAHRDLAEWQPDLVVFLGDFIYEGAGSPVGGERVRSHRGDEIQTLAAYRDRYAQYLGDLDLQASRAAAPWLAIWDDHEVENNYAGLIPQDPADLAGFADRRLAAYQAWWEHMPVRLPRPAADEPFVMYRTLDWGPLAKLVMIDGRQYRSDQACGDATLDFDPPCVEAADPDRTMLGVTQDAWVGDQLAGSDATWTVVGQQTIVSDLRLPNGAVINYDQWDGYDAARRRLLLQASAAERVVVLTGDIHIAGVGRLPGVGAEFVTTGISSLPPDLPAQFADSISLLFPDMLAAEFAHRGYTRHTVTSDVWLADYRIVADGADPASPVSTWRRFAVEATRPDEVLSLSAAG